MVGSSKLVGRRRSRCREFNRGNADYRETSRMKRLLVRLSHTSSVLLALLIWQLTLNHFAASACAQSTRNPAYWPFSSDSPWNTSIGSNVTTATITSGKFSSSGGAYLNVTEWGYPIYVGTSSDPLLNFYDSDGNELVASGRCPTSAAPDPSDDGSLIVINGAEAVEMWRAFRMVNGGDFYASAAVLTDLTSTGFFSGYHGTRAGGMSAVGGMIRREELINLNIPHALAVTMYPLALNRNAPGGQPFVWPASWADGTSASTRGASYGTSGNLYMGSLLIIPASVDINKLGLGPQGLAVAKAMQDYGAYITDTGGGNIIYYAEASSNNIIQSSLWNDVAKLTPYLKVVTNNTPTTIGGGGTRRRPAAPPLSLDTTPPPTNPNPQPTQGAAVSGRVTTLAGFPIANAKVVLAAQSGQLIGSVTTDSAGRYTLSNLADGRYYLAASASRFNANQKSLTISGTSQKMNIALSRNYY